MDRVLNFAIIGCGLIAATHVECIQEHPERTKLVAVYDKSQKAMDTFCEKYPAEQYTDLDKLLARKDLDVCVVLTPSGLHAELGIKVARAKKHIIMEKPIETTYAKAKALIDAAEENGVKLCMIAQHRFDEAVVALKSAQKAGELGKLNFCASHTKFYRDQIYYDSAPWRGTWALNGGGALINQSLHYIDLMLYMMGDAEEVCGYCATREHSIEVEDIAAAAIKFQNDAVGLVEGGTIAYPGLCARLDVYGSGGSVVIEDDMISKWMLKSGKTFEDYHIVDPEATAKIVASEDREDYGLYTMSTVAHKAQYKNIVDAILGKEELNVDGKSGLKALEVILAIYQSNRENRPIKLEEIRK